MKPCELLLRIVSMECELMMLRDHGCNPLDVWFFPLTKKCIHSSTKSRKVSPSVRNHGMTEITEQPPRGMENMLERKL